MSWSWFWQSSDVFTTFSLKYNKNCSNMDLFWKVVNMVCSTSWAPARWWQSFFYKFLCFTGSQDNSGCNGSQEVIQSNFLLKVVSIKRSDQVPQGFIQLHLGNLHGGRLITSPDSLLHCLTVRMVKKAFFLTFNLNLSCLNLSMFPLFPPQHSTVRNLASPSVSLWLGAGGL